MSKKRIMWLDFAKGITVFLVVVVHVVEGIYKTEMYPQYDVFSEMTMGLLFTIVMPIFFALSGYVYQPVQNSQDFLKKIMNKLFRLGMPYIIFSIIYKVTLKPINGVNGYILILSKLGLLTCKSKIELYFLSNVVPYPNNSNSS